MSFKYWFMRVLAVWIFPYLSVARGIVGRARKIEVPTRIKEYGFDDKVLAAVYIAVHGADGAGIKTWAALMSPIRDFTIADVEREASQLLGKVLLAQLKALPQQERLRILQDQAERLSSE